MTDTKRRKFVTILGASAAAIPVGALVSTLPSHAADTVELDPESTEAKNLQYITVSEDAEKQCSNCALYTGAADDEAGPCLLFQTPGTVVRAEGWCAAYAPKG